MKPDVVYELPQMKYPEQKGLISIIVPIYNTGNNLRECLDSIVAQTFANWEAILVDDGSTDSTGKIIDEYAEKDLRFIAIHKQNQGTLLARKTGLENSKGEFIANIDHDDKYIPQFLEKMYATITETNADFVYCKCQVTDEKNIFFTFDCKLTAYASENVAIMLMPHQGPNWVAWNKLIKRKIYVKVRFPDVNLIIGEDPVQMLQVAYHSKSAVFVPEALYHHEFFGVSVTTNSDSILWVKVVVFIKKTLENLFNGIIPNNVKIAFYCKIHFLATYNYFILDKNARVQFRDEIEPILPELIKLERKLNLRICLFLASKGIEFPFKLRENIRKLVKKI